MARRWLRLFWRALRYQDALAELYHGISGAMMAPFQWLRDVSAVHPTLILVLLLIEVFVIIAIVVVASQSS